MDDPGAFIRIMAAKIGDDVKLLRKNLDKAQKLSSDVDMMTAGKSKQQLEMGAKRAPDLFVFGLPLELLKTSPALIEFRNRLYPVVIPEFIFDLGNKLLACECSTGLFRIPANAKRVEMAMESIEARVPLNDISNLYGHDYCGLLKLWLVNFLPPLLPDIISGYFLRVFERLSTGKLSKEDACDMLMYLGRFVPRRNRETMAYLSHMMSNIARDSDKNGMNARNLAICCPNLFIGSYAQRCLDGRQFQAMMYLMEFFIINPHAFLPIDTAATLMKENEVSWVTLRKASPLPKLDFPSPHNPLHPDLANSIIPCSFQRTPKKALKGFSTPIRTQPFRGLGKVAVEIKNKMGRLAIPSCLKPGSGDSSSGASLRMDVDVTSSPDASRSSPASGVFPMPTDFPGDISAMVTPPRDQFRAARRSSTRSGVRRSFENLDRLGTGGGLERPLPLDFEDVIELLTPASSSREREPMTPSSTMSTHGTRDYSGVGSLDLHLDMAKELASVSFSELSSPTGPSR